MRAVPAVAGMVGFDTNQRVTRAVAIAMRAHGYAFVGRYIRRDPAASNDLSLTEIADCHAAGLLVFPVQHFGPTDGWRPTGALGTQYGATAARACIELGLPRGVTVFCDLEGVAHDVPADDVIRYADAWFAAVNAGGYEPGLYVGDSAILTAGQLGTLTFTRYWRALNLNDDQVPTPRGCCLRQHFAVRGFPGDPTRAALPAGVHLEIDTDTVMADARGGLPTFAGPDDGP